MSDANNRYEIGAAVLGHPGDVASWRRPVRMDGARSDYGPLLIVQCSAITGDGAYEPAQSVPIVGREGLLALRAAIDEALKEPQQ